MNTIDKIIEEFGTQALLRRYLAKHGFVYSKQALSYWKINNYMPVKVRECVNKYLTDRNIFIDFDDLKK